MESHADPRDTPSIHAPSRITDFAMDNQLLSACHGNSGTLATFDDMITNHWAPFRPDNQDLKHSPNFPPKSSEPVI
ncbi:hypothetical protein M752DRAFT_278456 [Aspergillus phoenicis ATCC 13157]|uniref:Uncharacterized protein n=1 Tax=Aspergillus phoenicis ATCC 13157 TaxID=1353007 RepID=A0A370PBB2_ASPPH|nr:hypothetical protein M752DRAFT_278456 [Aspergillus phoenicis ATCC 13157]